MKNAADLRRSLTAKMKFAEDCYVPSECYPSGVRRKMAFLDAESECVRDVAYLYLRPVFCLFIKPSDRV